MPTPDTEHKWYMSNFLRGTPPESVDAENGIVRGVAIVTEGEAKGHGVSLDSEFVEQVRTLGNAKKQGLKARFGHPSMSSTALGTFLGRFKNFRADGDITRADMFLSSTAKETPQGDLFGYMMSMAAEEPDMFGTSIVFTPGREYRRNKKGEKVGRPSYDASRDERDEQRREWEDAGPKTFIEIEELHAADVVDDPAANDGLFSAWNEATLAGQVSEFLDTHPDVLALIDKHPEVIDQFMARYEDYRGRATEETETDKTEDQDMATEQTDAGTEDLQQLEADNAAELATADEEVATDATETDATADAVDLEVGDAETATITTAELQAMTEAFGAEVACEVVLNGGTFADAQALHCERLSAENDALREQLRSQEADGETPAEFADADAKPEVDTSKYQDKGLTDGMARLAAANAERRNS